jgi:hypothetical protein
MKRRYVVALAVAVAVVALGSAAAAPDRQVLVVTDAETGEPYLKTPVDDGTVVALEYTHSVEKTRVYEAYTVRDDRLVMTRMEFESFGWGLPSHANVTRENGTFIYDPPGSYERLTVAPGRIAGHRLHVGNETYDLVAVSNGRSVTFSIHHRSAFAISRYGADR